MRSYNRPPIVTASLVVPLQVAQAALSRQRPDAACVAMGAFIHLARAYSGRQLTVAQSAQLVGEATMIRAVIACRI